MFASEPWALRETELDLAMLAHSESLFALSNGHFGLRGNLDEGEPHGIPGTYLNGFYETRPLPYAEAGYGYPEDSQTIVNVTNGKLIRLLVDDEPFDIRYGDLHHHERVLDLRDGVLRRTVEWSSPAGTRVRIRSTRLVSLVQRAAAAILYEVEPLDRLTRFVVQSELVANEPLPEAIGGDPRRGVALGRILVPEHSHHTDERAVLCHRTAASELRMGAGMHHAIDPLPAGASVEMESGADMARLTIAAEVAPGQRLRFVKFLAYGWSSQRSLPSVVAQIEAALASARRSGWDGLRVEQRAFLDEFWESATVELEGNTDLQLAVRFAQYHVLQAAARAEQRAVPGKGLTGPGYDGHTFWDSELYVLPILVFSAGDAAADALRWRQATLEPAKARAEQLGFDGAAFPWRTIHGEECSGYWPAGTAAFHINADIAHAVILYVNVTEDREFERDSGVELLVETARLWLSLGHYDAAGNFRIDGVTGPDEYSAVADNNVYTNLMAQENLRGAADAAERYPDRARDLHVGAGELQAWRDAADAMFIPYDEALGIHPQAEGFTTHAVWDFASTAPSDYPLMLHFPYFDLYRKQVVKQADLVMAIYTRSDSFTPEQKLRDFDYYESLTVRDSSLSASVQSLVAAEVGHLELAWDYFVEAALLDVADIHHDTRDGLHLAALAGAWIAVVRGFGGLRVPHGKLLFAPRLPAALPRLSYRIAYRGRRLVVEITGDEARYELHEGDPLELSHHGEWVKVAQGAPVTRAIPPCEPLPAPVQPAGRAPAPPVLPPPVKMSE